MFKAIFLLVFIFSHLAFAADENLKTYRIIRTSPHEFISALRISPTNQRIKRESQSRLAHFFKIKNRKVMQNSIEVEIIPDVPLLEEYFENRTLLIIKLSEISKVNQNYKYDVLISTKKKERLHALMEVMPHELGSLMSLQLIEKTASHWKLQAFAASLKHLGFVAGSPEEAVQLNAQKGQ